MTFTRISTGNPSDLTAEPRRHLADAAISKSKIQQRLDFLRFAITDALSLIHFFIYKFFFQCFVHCCMYPF